jgi:hypothetical protein
MPIPFPPPLVNFSNLAQLTSSTPTTGSDRSDRQETTGKEFEPAMYGSIIN